MGRWEGLKSATSVTEGKTLLKADALFKLVGVGGKASVATDTSLRAPASVLCERVDRFRYLAGRWSR